MAAANPIVPGFTPYVGKEQLTSLGTSAGFASIPANATWAIIKPRVSGVYVRLDGVAATSADMLLDVAQPVEITSKLADVRILQAAAGAIVDVWYFG